MILFYNIFKNILIRFDCVRSEKKMFFGRKPKNCCIHLPSEKSDNIDKKVVENTDLEKQRKYEDEKKLENIEKDLKCDDEKLSNSSCSSDRKLKKKIKKHKKNYCLKFQSKLGALINESQDMIDFRLTNIARRLDALEETIRYEIENIKNTQSREEDWEKYIYKQ